MTTAQLQTLKTDITVTNANTVYQGSTLLSLWQTFNYAKIADYYNTTASPQQDLWRPDILISEIIKVIVMSEFIAFTAVKQNGWLMLMQSPVIDATSSNIRASFSTIFGGTTITNLTALSKKAATNLEKLFSSANGTGFSSTLYGTTLSVNDIYQSLTA
jgi:hypothetical protein